MLARNDDLQPIEGEVIEESTLTTRQVTDSTEALAALVEYALDTVFSENTGSKSTVRAYESAFGYFLYFLGEYHKDDIAAAMFAAGKSPDTVLPLAQRARDGRRVDWVFSDAPSTILSAVTKKTLNRFHQWLMAPLPADCKRGECNPTGLGNAQSSAQIRRDTIMTLLQIAKDEGAISSNVISDIRESYKGKREKDETTTTTAGKRLTKDEARILRNTIIDGGAVKDKVGNAVMAAGRKVLTNKAARDLAIIDCMLYAGLRRAEVASLTGKSFTKDGERYILTVIGKGSKARDVGYVPKKLMHSLQDWMNRAGRSFGSDEPLFCSVNKGDAIKCENPITGGVVGRVVAEYGYEAGIYSIPKSDEEKRQEREAGITPDPNAPPEGRLGAHDLRRTCARHLYDAGVQLTHIQKILGHASIETTMKYIGVGKEEHFSSLDVLGY
jgi:integrase